MINLITGITGAGKTLWVLELALRLLRQGRKVYFVNFKFTDDSIFRDFGNAVIINDIPVFQESRLANPVEYQDRFFPCMPYELKDEQSVQVEKGGYIKCTLFDNGAAIFIDESQMFFPQSRDYKKAASIIMQSLAVHRHFALDYYFVCQDPKQIDTAIRHVCGAFYFITRPFGSPWQKVTAFPIYVKDAQKDRSGVVSRSLLDPKFPFNLLSADKYKEVRGQYMTTQTLEGDDIKFKAPIKLYLALLLPIAMVILVYFGFQSIDRLSGAKKADATPSPPPAPAVAAVSKSAPIVSAAPVPPSSAIPPEPVLHFSGCAVLGNNISCLFYDLACKRQIFPKYKFITSRRVVVDGVDYRLGQTHCDSQFQQPAKPAAKPDNKTTFF